MKSLNILLSLALILLLSSCRTSRNRGAEKVPDAYPIADTAAKKDKSTPQLNRGGVIEGNGGEHITNELNPWFLGTTPIRYCIVHDAMNFSLPLAAATQEIAKSLKAWSDFLASRDQINKLLPPFIAASNGPLILSMTYLLVDCLDSPDLTFYLGAREQMISDAIQYRSKDIIGLSMRSKYSDEKARGSGWIWLTPDRGPNRYRGPSLRQDFWLKSPNLYNVLMHELGHVYGFSHMSLGFMQAEFPSLIVQKEMQVPVTHNSLEAETNICGSIRSKDQANYRELFGIDYAATREICLQRSPSRDPALGLPSYSTFQFKVILTNGDSKILDFNVYGAYGAIEEVGGQFLYREENGELRYEGQQFMVAREDIELRGVLKVDGQDRYILLSSHFPGFINLSFGHGGEWKEVSVMEPTDETQSLYELFLEEDDEKF